MRKLLLHRLSLSSHSLAVVLQVLLRFRFFEDQTNALNVLSVSSRLTSQTLPLLRHL